MDVKAPMIGIRTLVGASPTPCFFCFVFITFLNVFNFNFIYFFSFEIQSLGNQRIAWALCIMETHLTKRPVVHQGDRPN